MIEQVTDKVSGTTLLEIILILLAILVGLIMVSNFLLKKEEYKKYEEDKYISVDIFLLIIGCLTIIIFLLIGYFNKFYSGLSIIEVFKFTLIETGVIIIFTIFQLFNNGYIGNSHFSGYVYAIIWAIFSIACVVALILLAILTDSLPILAAVVTSGITSLSSLINLIRRPDEKLPKSDGQDRIESQRQPMLEEVAEGSPQMLEKVPEGLRQIKEVVRDMPTDALEEAVKALENHTNAEEALGDVFVDTSGHQELDKIVDKYNATQFEKNPQNLSRNPLNPFGFNNTVNIEQVRPFGIDNVTVLPNGTVLQNGTVLPNGTQIIDPTRIHEYHQNTTLGITDLFRNPGDLISRAALTLLKNPGSIMPTTRAIVGGSGSKEKQKIIIVMICLILLILDKKK